MLIETKTPEEWLAMPKYNGVTIMDPDGWRGLDAPNWHKPITEAEFEQRLNQCTCRFVGSPEFLKG